MLLDICMKKTVLSSQALLLCIALNAQQALWGGASTESPVINQDGTVTFRYFAPKAVKVTVSGDFLYQANADFMAKLSKV